VFAEVAGPGIYDRLGTSVAVGLSGNEPGPITDVVPESLRSATPWRKLEFLAGRWCAAGALSRAGIQACELGRDAEGRPLWPAGAVGSITHNRAYAAALVAPCARWESVGIDSERILSASAADEVRDIVVTPEEWPLLDPLPLSREEFVTLIFSAKESLYKCLNPLVGVFFDFHSARLTAIDPDRGTFQLQLLTRLSERFGEDFRLSGAFEITGGLVHTALGLAAVSRI